jgi:hypothetical protein
MVRKTRKRTRRVRRKSYKGGDKAVIKPFAVVQYDDRHIEKEEQEYMNKNNSYCKKHGYEYIFISNGYEDLPPYWRKTSIVKNILSTGKYKGILWLDTDAYVYNPEITLESIVTDGYDFYISEDLFGSKMCAGVWIVMNTPLGNEILDTWIRSYNPKDWRKDNNKWISDGVWAGPTYEQGSFEKNILPIPKYNKHIKILDHTFLQATKALPHTFIMHLYNNLSKKR